MVVRLLLSSLPDLSLFPQNNISVFSQKIAFLRGSLLQKKSPRLSSLEELCFFLDLLSKNPPLLQINNISPSWSLKKISSASQKSYLSVDLLKKSSCLLMWQPPFIWNILFPFFFYPNARGWPPFLILFSKNISHNLDASSLKIQFSINSPIHT